MNVISSNLARIRSWSMAWLGARLLLIGTSALGGNIQTNWLDYWITNTVRVQMQANRFVTQVHTNWTHHVETNILEVYATNYVTKVLTNNLLVDLMRTNFVRAYRTNLQILNLTNWSTVIVFKTNWISQPMTNVVEVEMVRPSTTDIGPRPTAGGNASAPIAAPEPLELNASRGAPPAHNNTVQVVLSVRWATDPISPLQVQQWRVERPDGSVVCSGEEREFKRALPVGTYRIQVRVQRDRNGPLTVGGGTLMITPHDVLLAQKPSLTRSSI